MNKWSFVLNPNPETQIKSFFTRHMKKVASAKFQPTQSTSAAGATGPTTEEILEEEDEEEIMAMVEGNNYMQNVENVLDEWKQVSLCLVNQ